MADVIYGVKALVVLILAGIVASIIHRNPMYIIIPTISILIKAKIKGDEQQLLERVDVLWLAISVICPHMLIPDLIMFFAQPNRVELKTLMSRKGDKITLHSKTTNFFVTTYDSIMSNITGIGAELGISDYDTEFIEVMDPMKPPLDEESAIKDVDEVISSNTKSWQVTEKMIAAAGFVMAVTMLGMLGFVVGAYYLIAITSRKERSVSDLKDPIAVKANITEPVPLKNGVYRIRTSLLGYTTHSGIGYVQDGVFYTRYHVTNGREIFIDDVAYKPSYVNGPKDMITYGGGPNLARVADGEEIVIGLGGPYGNYITPYRTTCKMDSEGNMIFYGNRSIPGSSGSPVMKKHTVSTINVHGDMVESVTYRIAGTIGWFLAQPPVNDLGQVINKQAVEIVPTIPKESSSYNIDLDSHSDRTIQIFAHPGAGKTRTISKSLIDQGLRKYNKVYFYGPSLVVCEQAYKALEEFYPNNIALMTSDASVLERGNASRPIVITAHTTAASMIAKGDSAIRTTRALHIVDEAHFPTSFILKDLLRDIASKNRNTKIIEMTATGYDIKNNTFIRMRKTNHPVEDIQSTTDEMVDMILSKGDKYKILVYVTTLNGRQKTTAEYLATKLRQLPTKPMHYILSRNTFGRNYKLCMEMSKGVILSTSISECGANLHPDIVVDFQTQTKMVVHNDFVRLDNRAITVDQKIQRRGRLGRRPDSRCAMYVHPGNKLQEIDEDVVEHHERALVAKTLDIDVKDPVPNRIGLSYEPTAEQIALWLSQGENGIAALSTICLITDGKGHQLNSVALHSRLSKWVRGDNATVVIDDETYSFDHWDVRDDSFLKELSKMIPRQGKSFDVNSISRRISKVLRGSKKTKLAQAFILLEEKDEHNTNEDNTNEEFSTPSIDEEEDESKAVIDLS